MDSNLKDACCKELCGVCVVCVHQFMCGGVGGCGVCVLWCVCRCTCVSSCVCDVTYIVAIKTTAAKNVSFTDCVLGKSVALVLILN